MRNIAVIVLALAFAGVLAAKTDRPAPLTRNEAPVFDVRVAVLSRDGKILNRQRTTVALVLGIVGRKYRPA